MTIELSNQIRGLMKTFGLLIPAGKGGKFEEHVHRLLAGQETLAGGHISRRGDAHMRGLLYEAATVILTRTRADSDLRRWGLQLRERLGFKRAAIAVARKLAVIMHTMLKSGEVFKTMAVA